MFRSGRGPSPHGLGNLLVFMGKGRGLPEAALTRIRTSDESVFLWECCGRGFQASIIEDRGKMPLTQSWDPYGRGGGRVAAWKPFPQIGCR